jgi:hypothetical protein
MGDGDFAGTQMSRQCKTSTLCLPSEKATTQAELGNVIQSIKKVPHPLQAPELEPERIST